MSIDHRIVERIRAMANIPAGVPFNPVAVLDHVAAAVVRLHGAAAALAGDREVLRTLLCALAFDFGQREGHLDDIALLEWPPDPEPKPEQRVQEAPRGLVSLR